MDTITIFKPAGVEVNVVEGDPPDTAPLLAQVQALTSELATVSTARDVAVVERDALAAKLAAVRIQIDEALDALQ